MNCPNQSHTVPVTIPGLTLRTGLSTSCALSTIPSASKTGERKRRERPETLVCPDCTSLCWFCVISTCPALHCYPRFLWSAHGMRDTDLGLAHSREKIQGHCPWFNMALENLFPYSASEMKNLLISDLASDPQQGE